VIPVTADSDGPGPEKGCRSLLIIRPVVSDALDVSATFVRALARATEAEREAVLEARRSGRVSPAGADDVLFDVAARGLRYGG
jgi:hypothetical protein